MTEQSAIQYLQHRAKRLGWKDFDWAFIHLVLKPSEVHKIQGQDYLYIIIEVDSGITVESLNGYYGLNNKAVSQLIEEHTGVITVTNRDPRVRYARFLQGIPLNPQ